MRILGFVAYSYSKEYLNIGIAGDAVYFFLGETPLACVAGRTFTCRWCGSETLVCRPCDRGQQYCTEECRQFGRRASQRKAQKTFAKTPAGRHGNARRQAEFRQRALAQKKSPQKVTHHSSLLLQPVRKLFSRLLRPRRSTQFERNRCSICGRWCVPGISGKEYRSDEEYFAD